jgi:hypothetical protein
MNKKILIVVGLLVLAFVAGFLVDGVAFTGNVIEGESYTWTTAVCDDDSCIDVLIECELGSVKSMVPVSELKKFPEGWEDPRGESEGGFCK